jgi:hypothetical protein
VDRFVKALVVLLFFSLFGASEAWAAVSDTPQKTAWMNGTVRAVLYVGNTVYVGGAFTEATDSSGTVTRNNVAAINATTGQLLPWNPNTDGEVYSLAALGSGQIGLGGVFTTVGGLRHHHVAVVDPVTGVPWREFTGSASGKVRALTVGPNGWLYLGGAITAANGVPRSGLAAFDGNTLTDWAPNATGGAVLTLASANGGIFVGGTFTSIDNTSGSGYLDELTPTSPGDVVTSWNPNTSIPVHDLAITSSAVYAAADGTGGHLLAYNTSSGASKWTVYTDGGVQAVTVIGSDIYFGGHFDYIGQTHQHKLGLVNTLGQLQPWAPNANSYQGVFALDTNGTQLGAGGNFTKFNNGTINQPHFAQFN